MKIDPNAPASPNILKQGGGMTPESQRIAIAEACGWTILPKEVHQTITYDWGLRPGFIHEENKEVIPNYLSDLNAMHEATMSQGIMFRAKMEETLTYMPCDPVFATAAQRAEAFLKTLNLWDDSK